MTENIIYGPVPSRRLGLSLGVDLVPYKVCSYNCVYCQIGPTKKTTVDRKPYVSSEDILSQLFHRLKEGISPDYITLAGSGEPTLNSEIKRIIHRIKEQTDIPVTVLTNGSLLSDETVRNDICDADVVLPSLDAADESVFNQINRPHPDILFERMVDGLIEFRKIYAKQIWLEIFLIDGINATETYMASFKRRIRDMQPDKIHLNTAVRPTAESSIHAVSQAKLQHFCKILGDKAEVIAPFKRTDLKEGTNVIQKDLLNMLARRPCTLEDLSAGLGLHKNEILKYLDAILAERLIKIENINGKSFYKKSGNKSMD